MPSPTDATSHFSSLILELLGFQVSSLSVPVLLAQQVSDSKQIMAAFQSGAAANNICYGAESQRYLGTATFMLKRKSALGRAPKNKPAKLTKIKFKEKYIGGGGGVKRKKALPQKFAAYYPLIKRLTAFKAH